MKPLIKEIGSSSWVFQEIKYLSDLSNEKLNDFTLKIVENLEWINEYMEDVFKNCRGTFCDYSKKSSFICSEVPLISEKGSDFVCQENFGKESLLLKSLSFKLIPSPLKDLKGSEFIDIPENIDINYDILSESEDSSLSIMESNEQNINLKYDSSSTRVMEMITEEDEVDEEILDGVEIKGLSRNDDIETKFSCVLKKDNNVSPDEKSFKSDIEKSVKFKKDYDIILENKDAKSPPHDWDSPHHLDSRIISGPNTSCASTSIIQSYFSPAVDNTVNKVSFSPPALSSSLNFVSLPPREPLNTKKSLGKRVSRHGSFSETVKSQRIVDSKLYGMLKQENQEDSFVSENRLSGNLQKQHVLEEISGKKMVFDEIDKHDISEQRLKTVFTSGSQRIHEALNSLRIAKPTSGQFKLVSTEQKLQPDTETKIFESENNSIALNQVSNAISNVSSGECLHETAPQIENEECWVSRFDVLNRSIVNTAMKQEKERPFHDTNEIKNEPNSDEGLTASNKLEDTSQRRTSIITVPAISVIGAIQAARNSATQAIRKATSVFFTPSSKVLPRNSVENVVEQPLKALNNNSCDENTCLDSKRISDLKVNLEKNNEVLKNATCKVEIEQPCNIIETKHNSTKTCDYGKETNINKTRFLAKKSSTLANSIPHEEVNLMTNKFVSQELSCQNLKIQPSQPVKLTSFNSVFMPKNKPVSIRVTTASQRQANLAEKRKVQKTDFATSLQQSFTSESSQNQDNCPVTDTLQYNDSCPQELSVLSRSQPAKRLIPSKGIKALTVANLARKREQEEKDRKLAHKREIERKRQENLKKQEENKKQEQWHREDLQRKVHPEKTNDTKKKLLQQRLEHSSSVAKKICTISSDNNARGPLEDIINNDGKSRDTLNMEVKPFKRVIQDDLMQENWNSFSVSNKPLFQEVKKRKTDDNTNKNISSMPIHISSVKDDKDPFVVRTQTREKGSCLNIQTMSQKHTKLLQDRYQGNQQISSSKNGKTTGPVVDIVKFSTDNIRFGGESSKTVPVSHQYPQSESIELPEIDSDYSDDDELKKRFKTTLPQWAESPELMQILRMQAKIDPDKIFGPIKPLQMEEIFRGKDRAHVRFRSRSSSANWSGQDRLTEKEIENYAKIMGYKT
ncbi:hypothetical protein T552_01555 [Pneumocystis carinii B80]|uniref:Inner centromere protein ARK-binding domain-containing protein n=1 Tax=Pneumocystis carinii (strain B80) TaxID=1408658 RepID=A0A0W4ZKM0_PNEC8|nr:hypothetical protein T552_01555 [Pneumocystis carinii B80]KTW28927.1 hypothetical protein T552_01555 [Pneumocystis carinii B80]